MSELRSNFLAKFRNAIGRNKGASIKHRSIGRGGRGGKKNVGAELFLWFKLKPHVAPGVYGLLKKKNEKKKGFS